jgi:energy-converting hydrogenase B subunit D
MGRPVTFVAALYDVLLAGALVWTAARALGSANLLTAIALFVAFGLLMTLVWVRLAAPDVALAEAGIGTGFSGALFFAAIARLRRAAAEREAVVGQR